MELRRGSLQPLPRALDNFSPGGDIATIFVFLSMGYPQYLRSSWRPQALSAFLKHFLLALGRAGSHLHPTPAPACQLASVGASPPLPIVPGSPPTVGGGGLSLVPPPPQVGSAGQPLPLPGFKGPEGLTLATVGPPLWEQWGDGGTAAPKAAFSSFLGVSRAGQGVIMSM